MFDCWSREDIRRIITDVREKALGDQEFLQLCLVDPAAAVKAASGKELPPGVELRFEKNEIDGVIAVFPDIAESEIKEDDLDSVAGGTFNGTGGPEYISVTCKNCCPTVGC